MNDNQVLNLVPLIEVTPNKWMLVEDNGFDGGLFFLKLIKNEQDNSLLLLQKIAYYPPNNTINISVSTTKITFFTYWVNRKISYYIQSENIIKLLDEIIFRIFPVKKQIAVNMNLRTYCRLQGIIEEKLRTYYPLVHQQVLNLVPNA